MLSGQSRSIVADVADWPALETAVDIDLDILVHAAGLYPSIPEAARAMAATGAEYLPDDDRARTYDGLYAVYRDIYPRLKDTYAALREASS